MHEAADPHSRGGILHRTQIEKIDPKYADTTSRFAGLMRELTRRNGGTFLGVAVSGT